MRYECGICYAIFAVFELLRLHLYVHRFEKMFTCNLGGCNLSFKSYSTFDGHLRTSHGAASSTSRHELKYKCTAEGCSFSNNNFETISQHLRDHLGQGICVSCPVLDCQNKIFKNKNSYYIHNSRDHRNLALISENESTDEQCDSVSDEGQDVDMSFESPLLATTTNCSSTENVTKTVGLMLLSLLAKHHVASIAVQQIVDCFSEISNVQEASNQEKIKIFTSSVGLSENESNDLFRGLVLDNFNYTLFNTSCGIFRSDYMRKKFFKSNYSFVEPVKIDLGINKERKECFFYYVPIIDTIKSLLTKNDNYKSILTPHRKNDRYMSDYTDGKRFGSNIFLQEQNVLHIMLYQDGFGTVNPLGDAKTRHKIVGVYFSIGNMHRSLRATTDNEFLAMLCLEKDFNEFGTHRIFSQLVDDIKTLETDGMLINVENENILVRGTIFAILGDNLGTHQIAGLVKLVVVYVRSLNKKLNYKKLNLRVKVWS